MRKSVIVVVFAVVAVVAAFLYWGGGKPETVEVARPRPARAAAPTTRPAAAPAVAVATAVTSSQRPFPESYKVLLARSIFLGRSNSAATTKASEKPADEGLAIKGIVQEDARYVAFVENTRDGGTFRVRSGDHLGRGRIARITMRALDVESGGKTLTVRVGQTLNSGAVAVADVGH